MALRKNHGEGNLKLRVPETGGFIPISQIDDDQARDLAELLGPMRAPGGRAERALPWKGSHGSIGAGASIADRMEQSPPST